MVDVLVDTDILIDVARGITDAITYVQNLERRAVLGISSITYEDKPLATKNQRDYRFIAGLTLLPYP